jgi:hypothetical protein
MRRTEKHARTRIHAVQMMVHEMHILAGQQEHEHACDANKKMY